jgi:hypothetical protein
MGLSETVSASVDGAVKLVEKLIADPQRNDPMREPS